MNAALARIGQLLRTYFWDREPAPAEVLLEQVRWLHSNFVFALTASALGVWVILLTTPMSAMSLAAGVLYTSCAFTCEWIRHFQKLTLGNIQQQARLAVWIMTSLGACLAFVGFCVFAEQDSASILVFTTVGTGILAGALGFASVHLPAFGGFAIPPMLLSWGISIWHYNDGRVWMSMFWGIPILAMAYWHFSLNAYNMAASNIQLRFSNRDLLRQLEIQIMSSKAAQQRAEDADLAKSKFLAAASHDLRQPVHALGLFLNALERASLPAHQQEILDNADTAWQACKSMLDALLDFSRIQAGIVNPQYKAFALQPTLFKMNKEFGSLADHHHLVLRLHDTRVWVWADPMLLEMVLRNLLSNALRYTENGGVLMGVRTRQSHEAVVEVWDTGIGIAQADQASVFKEFHQLGNPQRDHRKGLGLGLAIAEGLMASMGGRISLKSQAGRGSVFRLHLPLAPPCTAQAAALDSTALTRVMPGWRALLIDDNPMVLDALAVTVGKIGLDYRVAETLEEAFARLDPWTPNVVITDYRLRGHQTGADAVHLLRQKLGPDLAAIIITGDTEPARLRDAHRIGALLLHKPVTPDQLLQALLRLQLTAPPDAPSR